MDNNEIKNEQGIYSSASISEIVKDNSSSAVVSEQMLIKKAKRKGRLQGFLISLGVMLALFIAIGIFLYNVFVLEMRYVTAGIKYSTGSSDIITKESANKLNKLYSIIDSSFLFDYDRETVETGMYKGLFEALGDEYSVYYTKDEYEEMMASYSDTTFCGIGAYLQYNQENGTTVVVRPMLDSPAEKAGLLKDDIIMEVDGENVVGMDLDMVVSKVRGPEGQAVKLKILRGDKEMNFEIVRAEITESTVSSEIFEDNIGYIYITSFEDQTDEQFIKSINLMLDRGIESLIIDLRSNGGGYVDSATNIADRLLGEGKVLTMVDRNGKSEVINSDEENKVDLPMVVLIDGYTASASEILTGALRDYGVATTVGTKSFGKGIVQDVIPLKDGTGLKITTAEYLTPSGECIHKKGIEPDVLIEFDSDKYINDGIDNQLEKAKEIVKAK